MSARSQQDHSVLLYKYNQISDFFLLFIFCFITRGYFIDYNKLQEEETKREHKITKIIKGEMCAVTKGA